MWLSPVAHTRILHPCRMCCTAVLRRCCFSQKLENKYSEMQKEKILKVINDDNVDVLSHYDISKGRLKKICQWRENNGVAKTVSDVELIDGFSEKTAAKLFDSILEGPIKKELNISNRIKGQILHPNLSESLRKSCKSALAVYISVNSVCWTLIDKEHYKVLQWRYHAIDYSERKKLQVHDILDIAWGVIQELPEADVYVMKAQPTTLRSAGSDPNNPKVMSVNLQKAQLIAMMVALINARDQYLGQDKVSDHEDSEEDQDKIVLNQKVYFLRETLPYRLYGTLIGNERVSTDQTVEMLLEDTKVKCPDRSHVYIPEKMQNIFRSQRDLPKDMLGHSLLLALTFMDLCIYRNQDKIKKLLKKAE